MIRFRTLSPRCLLLVLVSLIAGCSTASQPVGSTVAPAPSVAAPPTASTIILGDEQTLAIPAVQREQERRQEALATSPYILLRPGLEGRLGAAQEAVVNDGRVQSAARKTTGQRLRTEVMIIAEARAGDIPSG